MGETLYCSGQMYVTEAYADGWIRTYIGYPDMNKDIKDMLKGWAKKGQFAKILIFFSDKCDFDNDYASFLMREISGGYI